MTELFRCTRLHCTVTLTACAKRHERAKRDSALIHPRALTTLNGSPCLRCPIGIEAALPISTQKRPSARRAP